LNNVTELRNRRNEKPTLRKKSENESTHTEEHGTEKPSYLASLGRTENPEGSHGERRHDSAKELRISQLFSNSPTMTDSGFSPTKEQSLARVDFHAAFNAGRFLSDEGTPLSLTAALERLWSSPLAFHSDMGKWLKISGFRKWFSRPPIVELHRMTGLLMEKAMESVYRILTSENERLAASQVSAARLVLELSDALPDKRTSTQVILDTKVSAMSDDEKRKLIAEAAKMQAEDAEFAEVPDNG